MRELTITSSHLGNAVVYAAGLNPDGIEFQAVTRVLASLVSRTPVAVMQAFKIYGTGYEEIVRILIAMGEGSANRSVSLADGPDRHRLEPGDRFHDDEGHHGYMISLSPEVDDSVFVWFDPETGLGDGWVPIAKLTRDKAATWDTL